MFLKNRNISSKIKRSKVTDYAALNRGSYMSAHVFLNLSNESGGKEKNARLAEHFISFSQ